MFIYSQDDEKERHVLNTEKKIPFVVRQNNRTFQYFFRISEGQRQYGGPLSVGEKKEKKQERKRKSLSLSNETLISST